MPAAGRGDGCGRSRGRRSGRTSSRWSGSSSTIPRFRARSCARSRRCGRTRGARARRCRRRCGGASTRPTRRSPPGGAVRCTRGTTSSAGSATAPRSSPDLADATMSHDDTWRFIVLGRSLERVDLTVRLLSTRLGDAWGTAGWVATLRCCARLRVVPPHVPPRCRREPGARVPAARPAVPPLGVPRAGRRGDACCSTSIPARRASAPGASRGASSAGRAPISSSSGSPSSSVAARAPRPARAGRRRRARRDRQALLQQASTAIRWSA